MNNNEKKRMLLRKKNSLLKELDRLKKEIEDLSDQVEDVDEEIYNIEIDNDDGSFKSNYIKDLVNIFRFEWQNDKKKTHVVQSYITTPLLESNILPSDFLASVTCAKKYLDILYWNEEIISCFKGILFHVVEYLDAFYVFMALVYNEPVTEKERLSVKEFRAFDDIKYKSSEYKFFSNEDIKNRIIIMTRYKSKNTYSNERIEREFKALLNYAKNHCMKTQIERLPFFATVLPMIYEVACDHGKRELSIKIPFIGFTGNCIYYGPYKAFYCKTCDIYYISSKEFDKLSSNGKPLIMREKNTLIGDNRTETELHICGYNVDRKNALTEIERQKLLATIIKNDIISKDRIMSLLNFYIWRNKNNINMREALSKWTKDRLFVENF